MKNVEETKVTGNRRINRIEELVGETLSGVAFVRDYVEFCFEEKVVRALSMPFITTANGSHEYTQPGWRDALCSAIGSVAQEVRVKEHDEIMIVLSGDRVIHVPLDEKRKIGPESAHFVRGRSLPIDVW